jgi:Flp pilus assembly pilin Flp
MNSLKAQFQNFVDSVKAFDRDEDGIESIQVVMILAFGAVVMVAAWAFWDQIKGWADGLIQGILGKS